MGSSLESTTPALEAVGVSKSYGRGVQALTNVDARIEWGRITALVGPNAAGKSTLIKTWVGFERPSAGRVFVGGIDPWAERGRALRLLAYLPQSPALFPEMSVEEHLNLAVHLRSAFSKSDAAGRLKQAAIPMGARVRDLSGGQRAQVALAVAVCSHARVLLLDEPLASLDPLARREFLDVLKEAVQTSGIAALLSSHVVSDIEYAADWLIVLGVGRKLLDMGLSETVARHHVVVNGDGDERDAVARLPGNAGLLVRSAKEGESIGRRPTLEEVVMGYLASGRTEVYS